MGCHPTGGLNTTFIILREIARKQECCKYFFFLKNCSHVKNYSAVKLMHSLLVSHIYIFVYENFPAMNLL